MTAKTKITLPLFALCALLAGSGCSTVELSNDHAVQTPLKILPATFKPKFEVSQQRISATATSCGIPGFSIAISSGSSNCDMYVPASIYEGLSSIESEALRKAIYTACEKNRVEYLLLPHYKMKTHNLLFWQDVTCTVYGTPARVREIEVVETPEETVELNLSANVKNTSGK